MSRRIEVELTSTRADGVWTWRAAGAKLPKGELNGALLYDGAKVGDVVRADAEQVMDGIEIIAVLPPKGARKEPERIEVIGSPRRDDEPLVTTRLAPKGRGGDRRDRRPRRDGDDRGGDRRSRGPRSDRGGRGDGGDRSEGGSGSQDARRKRGDRAHHKFTPAGPLPEPRPKAKRLRPGRTHRNAVLAELPAEQKPIAEQVLKGGIPAVRQAVEKQNETNRAEGRPEIDGAALVTLAEQLLPALKTAEWRDRAEAAIAEIDELDLRDLRSVITAADGAARDEELRAMADTLRAGLATRVDAEQAAWIVEITALLDAGRAVRALRVSSRPPKAGSPLPAELASRLAEATAESLTAETGQDRFATVLDALAYSPVRAQVTPKGIPTEPTEALLAAVRKVASRLPEIAKTFGIEPAAPKAKGRGPRPPKPPVAPAGSPVESPAGSSTEVEASAPGDGPTAEITEAPVEGGATEPNTEPAEEPHGESAPSADVAIADPSSTD